MIHLLSVPRLGQAGVKRLHLTLPRIRRQNEASGSRALLNSSEIIFVFKALPFSMSGRLPDKGLKLKRITAPTEEAPHKKPLASVRAFHEPCFSRVARQPQQPAVQALKKI